MATPKKTPQWQLELKQLRSLLEEKLSPQEAIAAYEKLSAEKHRQRLETNREQREARAENTRLRHQRLMQSQQTVCDARSGALKAIVLINGGAAVAILTLIGHLATDKDKFWISNLQWVEGCFAFGVFFAAGAAGAAYLNQRALDKGAFANGPAWKVKCTTFCMLALGASSYVAFIAGVLLAINVFAQSQSVSRVSLDSRATNSTTARSLTNVSPPTPGGHLKPLP